MTPLTLALMKFEALARDLSLSTIDGDPIAVAAQLRTLLEEIIPMLEQNDTYRARRAKAEREQKARAEADAVRVSRTMDPETVERIRRESAEVAKGFVPPMQPWKDIQTGSEAREGN